MKIYFLVFSALMLASGLSVQAQNVPSHFGGVIEYRLTNGGSAVQNQIIQYNADGSYHFLFGQQILEGAATYSNPALEPAGTYRYDIIDATHARVSLDASDPGKIVEFANQGVGKYDNRVTLSAYIYRATFVAPKTRGELANTSIRTFVNAHKSSLVGFVVTGPDPRYVLIRTVGPGLKAFGVTDTLADPGFVLMTVEGTKIATIGSLRTPVTYLNTVQPLSAIKAVAAYLGAFPLADNSDDAAVLIELQPGVYVVDTHSSAGTNEGEVLTEVYVMP